LAAEAEGGKAQFADSGDSADTLVLPKPDGTEEDFGLTPAFAALSLILSTSVG